MNQKKQFEVGKKYKSNYTQKVFECVYAGKQHVILTYKGDEYAFFQDEFSSVTEYKEPIRVVRYFNLYPTAVQSEKGIFGYENRVAADNAASNSRIACKRVEFTEGEFDE